MTINARIKKIRKDSGLNQKDFSEILGVTQSGVSYMEQDGRNVSDLTIKSICNHFCINEKWLIDEIGPMYIEPDTFSLDDFVKSKGASNLELEIVKAYFELDLDIRKKLINHFKEKLISTNADLAGKAPDTNEELEQQFPPVDTTINDKKQIG